MDDLPPKITQALTGAIVRALDVPELRRAFGVVTEALLVEVDRADPGLAKRLAGTLASWPAERRVGPGQRPRWPGQGEPGPAGLASLLRYVPWPWVTNEPSKISTSFTSTPSGCDS
jgi:hypothetical protein